ncbi:hypothetical protein, partial [Breoghania sp. JC706]|uniref:hypothetical protein n=1 Tax=Breoghania sp. JC706 TaxID=3117732 RepID=UPI003009D2F6
ATYARLVDNPIYTRMNMEGRSLGSDLTHGGDASSTGASVENLVKYYERGAVAQYLRGEKKLYRAARKAGKWKGRRRAFTEAVAHAARRGDVDPDGNEFVSEAAQLARQKIFDPLLKRMQELRILPDDLHLDTALSYVTRVYDRPKIIARASEFKAIVRRHVSDAVRKAQDRQEAIRIARTVNKGEELKPSLPKGAADAPDFISPEDFNDYVNEIVNSVYDNVTGNGQGDMPQWLTPATRGPLKGRTLHIPDVELEDFLVSDMEAITRQYARTAGAEVELTAKFGRADMRDQFKALDDEYHQKLDAAKTERERKSLKKAFERDKVNLSAFRDMIRGTYRSAEQNSNWGRLTRAALTFNYMRLLGGVALSSLSDLSRSVAVHGVRATMRDGLPILVSRLRAAKISRADARALGAVTETVLQSRLAQLAELTDPYAYGSTFERFLSNSSNVFSRLTFLGAWNDTMKTMAAVMTQNRIMRNALRPGAMSREERAYMAYLGFDDGMMRRIAAQFRTHGVREKNVYGANVEAWDDDIARRAFAAALNKDVDRTIVTKGVADTPLWTHSNWGKVVTQFQSFALASHQRVLIAGLQERPHRLAEQMVFSTALGMLVSWAKYKERGDDDRAERLLDNPGEWIANGLDRSGLLAIPFQISNTMDKIGVSHVGPVPVTITSALQTMAGDRDTGGTVSRYASRNWMGALFGPSVGLVQDLVTIASQVARGEVDRHGAKAMLRLVPGGTLPGARTLLNTKVRPALENAVE